MKDPYAEILSVARASGMASPDITRVILFISSTQNGHRNPRFKALGIFHGFAADVDAFLPISAAEMPPSEIPLVMSKSHGLFQ